LLTLLSPPFFILIIQLTHRLTLFPYTTLFRSNWITPHSFLSLNWDEWASIIAILTAIVIILRWLLTRADEELFDPIRHQLQDVRSEEHTSELQSRFDLVCRLLLEKKK